LPKFSDNVLLFAALGSLALPFAVRAELISKLTVEVNGQRNQQGQICLSLFASGKGFPSNETDAIQNRCVAATATAQLVTFENLKPGSYAVAVLHDSNSDGEANSNALGIPVEGFGFSRNPVIRTGPPKFNDAVVLVLGSSTNIQIKLNYF
jgi:uncharacterized protein (DUF2141 family)